MKALLLTALLLTSCGGVPGGVAPLVETTQDAGSDADANTVSKEASWSQVPDSNSNVDQAAVVAETSVVIVPDSGAQPETATTGPDAGQEAGDVDSRSADEAAADAGVQPGDEPAPPPNPFARCLLGQGGFRDPALGQWACVTTPDDPNGWGYCPRSDLPANKCFETLAAPGAPHLCFGTYHYWGCSINPN